VAFARLRWSNLDPDQVCANAKCLLENRVDPNGAVAVTLSATRSFVRFNGRIASMYPFEFTDSLRYPESYDREHTLSSKLARMLLDGRR